MARTKVSTLQSPDHDAFTRILARDLRIPLDSTASMRRWLPALLWHWAHEWINEIDERDGVVPPSVPTLLESAAPVPSPRPATSFPVHITTVAAVCASCAGEARIEAGAPSIGVVPLDDASGALSFARSRPVGVSSGELAPVAQPAVVTLQEQPQPFSPRSPRPPHRQLSPLIPVIPPSAPFSSVTPESASDAVALGTSAPAGAPLHSTLRDLLNPPSTARPPTSVPIPAIQVQPPTSEDLFGDGGVTIVPLVERDDDHRDNRQAPTRSSSLSSLPSTSQGTSEHTGQGSHASEVGQTLEAGGGVQRPSEDRTLTTIHQSRKRKSTVVEPPSPQKALRPAMPLAERTNGAERNRHGGGTLSAQSSSGSFDLPFQLPSS
ncbi:uncharacterized protein JCM10292_000090 [Rhodotorula paludigena]|uniref:uncharacterized protein n=1 Tax=Rhodotorula paludigena TaxID=86838 RepID=UPI0031713953